MLSLILSCAALVPQGVPVNSTVVINEFIAADGGSDDRNFVELYNKTSSDIDITDWKLVHPKPGGSSSELVFTAPMPGVRYVIPANGYFVIGDTIVPGVLNGGIDKGNFAFSDNTAAFQLFDSNDNIMDVVTYQSDQGGGWAPSFSEGQGIWGRLIAADGFEASYQRTQDGLDTDNNGYDFSLVFPWTPNAPNFPQKSVT